MCVVPGQQQSVHLSVKLVPVRPGKYEGSMLRRLSGSVVTLISGLALAACAFDGTSPPISSAVPPPRPAPKFAAAPVMPIWRHLPETVSAQQLNEDKAKCTKIANSTPGVGSPEIKFYLAFTNCMRSEGYEATSSL
jgi:hypothetical protein